MRITKVDEYLDIDISALEKMSESEYRKVVRTLADAANKRIKRLRESDISSFSIAYNRFEDRKFATKGKDLNALKSEYKELKSFMSMKTSTVTGTRKFKKTVEKKIKKNISNDTWKNMWQLFNKLKKENRGLFNIFRYDTIIDYAEDIVTNNDDINENYDELINTLEKIYEKQFIHRTPKKLDSHKFKVKRYKKL